MYLFVSASALASTVVVRSAFGAGFPVSVMLYRVTAMLTAILVICVSDVRKTRTRMGVLSRRLFRPRDDSCTIYFDKVWTGNPLQIQIRTPPAIIQGVCLESRIYLH